MHLHVSYVFTFVLCPQPGHTGEARPVADAYPFCPRDSGLRPHSAQSEGKVTRYLPFHVSLWREGVTLGHEFWLSPIRLVTSFS